MRLPWSEIKRLVDGESLNHFDISPEYEGSWGLKVVPRQGRSIVATAVTWKNPPTKSHRLCAIAARHGVAVTVRGFPSEAD